jgi:predicted DNA-binding ribbon-helix-helix protein
VTLGTDKEALAQQQLCTDLADTEADLAQVSQVLRVRSGQWEAQELKKALDARREPNRPMGPRGT